MKIYTIGFTKKSAKDFFNTLKKNNISRLVDIRLNNASQLAGFSKGADLKYFLKELCQIDYTHDINLAPTKEILDDYKKHKITWTQYENRFNDLLTNRNIISSLNSYLKEPGAICLLCSESTPENCHRRLVAEYVEKHFSDLDIEIIHL